MQYVRDRQKRYSRHNFTLTDEHNVYSSDYTEANPKELARCNKEPYSKVPDTQMLYKYTTQHNTTQHNTTQHNTTQHNTTQHNTTQHNTTQHNTTQHNTTQHNITQQQFCESSGVVSFVPDDIYPPGSLQNVTRFLMCYDRLANGFTGPALPAKDAEAPQVDEVYCAMMAVNDTNVVHETTEKSKEYAKREEDRKTEQEERERKKEAQEEQKEKAAENKAAAWNEVYTAYVTQAQRYEEEDGELVVVMDFLDEFKEFYE